MSSDFHTTHWSVVLTAKGDDTAAKAALKVLCETYYPPIHKYLQRSITADCAHCYGGRDATDLTHDFFTQILEGKMFAQLQRDGAPFRKYLLGAVRLFLSQLRIRESTEKRGGGFTQTALHGDLPEINGFDDAVFDRDWARAMIQRAIHTLDHSQNNQRQESQHDMPEMPIKKLLPWMIKEMTAETRGKLAAELGMSDVAIKVALHRLRKKFRKTIRAQIAETVKDASEIDDELDHLIRALQGNL